MNKEDNTKTEVGTKLDFSVIQKRMVTGNAPSPARVVIDQSIVEAARRLNGSKKNAQIKERIDLDTPTRHPVELDSLVKHPVDLDGRVRQSAKHVRLSNSTPPEKPINTGLVSLLKEKDAVQKFFWTGIRKKLLFYLKEHKTHISSNALIAEKLGASVGGVRCALRDAVKAGLIKKEAYQDPINKKEQGLLITPLFDLSTPELDSLVRQPSSGVESPIKKDLNQKERLTNEIKPESKFCPEWEKLRKLCEEDIEVLYPNLSSIGFKKLQLIQLLDHCAKPEKISISLDHAEFALEEGLFLKKGRNVIDTPQEKLKYFMGGMRKFSYWDAPKGFLSVDERIRRDEAQAAIESSKTRELEKTASIEKRLKKFSEADNLKLKKYYADIDGHNIKNMFGPISYWLKRYEEEFPNTNPLELPE